jgi:O-antigen ligase
MNVMIKESASTLSLIFIISIVSLDVSFGITSFKVGNILLIASCVLITLIGMLSIINHSLELRFGASDKMYFILVFIVLLSSMWSPSSINAIFQGGVMILLWIAAMFLVKVGVERIIKQFIYVAVFVALISFLLIPLAPHQAFQPSPSGSMPELRGIFHHQLRFGLFMGLTLGLLVLIWLNDDRENYFKSNFSYFFVFVIILFALILSFARLYTLFSLLALALTLAFSTKGLAKTVYFFAILAFISLLVIFSQELIYRLDYLGFDTTLTGRVRIWEKSLEIASDNGLWGYGFASFDHHMFDRLWGFYRPAHAHNSFIQAYFEIGIIGFITLIGLVISNFRDIYSNRDATTKYSYAGFVFFLTLLGSLTGANYASKPTLIFSLMLVLIVMERNPKKAINFIKSKGDGR